MKTIKKVTVHMSFETLNLFSDLAWTLGDFEQYEGIEVVVKYDNALGRGEIVAYGDSPRAVGMVKKTLLEFVS